MDKRRIIGRWGDGKIVDESQQIGVVSSILCGNIARPIQTIIPFEEFKEAQQPSIMQQAVIVRGGKPVRLTNAQAKIVFALSQEVTAQRGEERMRKYIESINQKSIPDDEMTFVIDLKILTKKTNPSIRISQREIDDVAKDLVGLIDTKQSFRDGDIEYNMPFFTNKGEKYKYDKEGIKHLESIALSFCPMFFHQLGKGFAMIPDKLFEVWGKKGTRSDLFVNLLSQLWSVFGNHHSAFEIATRSASADNRAKAQRNALLYSEYSTTIQSRTTTDYNSSRAMKKKFYTDVQNTCEAIKELGLITEYKLSKTSRGERWDFWFNPDYNKSCEIELISSR